jgi:hypothetical protein
MPHAPIDVYEITFGGELPLDKATMAMRREEGCLKEVLGTGTRRSANIYFVGYVAALVVPGAMEA